MEAESGLGEEAVEDFGVVLDAFEARLDDGGEVVDAGGGEVAQAALEDRHVLAAAVHARAQVLVTSNLADFPEASAEPYGIEVLHPDQFCLDLFDLAPDLLIRAIEARAARYKRPPRTLPEGMEHLKHPQRLPGFANEACRYIARRGWR